MSKDKHRYSQYSLFFQCIQYSGERNFSVKIVVDFFLVLRYNMGGRGSFWAWDEWRFWLVGKIKIGRKKLSNEKGLSPSSISLAKKIGRTWPSCLFFSDCHIASSISTAYLPVSRIRWMYVSNVIFVLACPSRVEIVLMSIYMRKKIEMSKESSERN